MLLKRYTKRKLLKIDPPVQERSGELRITTVVLRTSTKFYQRSLYTALNRSRIALLERILDEKTDADVILFPAGFLEVKRLSRMNLNSLTDRICAILRKKSSPAVLCFGIDGGDGCDQLAVAVNQSGIEAVARKFYPTKDEKSWIRTAPDHQSGEIGYDRWFQMKGHRLYLAVCYDCFGLRHCGIENSGFDAVLTLAHRFHRKGEGSSGDVDFARKGFAGTSQQWNCPVFGTAAFFDREIPPAWPTGVLWNTSSASVKNFKYSDNQLQYISCDAFDFQPEAVRCYDYLLPEHQG